MTLSLTVLTGIVQFAQGRDIPFSEIMLTATMQFFIALPICWCARRLAKRVCGRSKVSSA